MSIETKEIGEENVGDLQSGFTGGAALDVALLLAIIEAI